MASVATNQTINERYEQEFAGSARMFERARKSIVGGITHDGRHIKPFPPYISHADGAYKWDVDGHQLIDYAIGHGSLILGHNDPEISEALRDQITRGTHFSAGHEGEIVWAEKVIELVPSAESVRFTASGTEATLLAMRVARGFTEKTTVVKFEGHFHGWQDYALKGEKPPFESTTVPGIPKETLGTVSVLPANDPAMLEERLVQGDVAAVILEPSGGSWSTIPVQGRLPRQGSRTDEQIWRGAHFRRSDHRFPLGPGRRPAALRRHSGHDDDGQDYRRRHARRGRRRSRGHHGNDRVQGCAGLERHSAHPAGRHLQRKSTGGGSWCSGTDNVLTQPFRPTATISRRRFGLASTRSSPRLGVPAFAWGDSSVFHVALGQPATNLVAEDLRSPEGVSVEFLKGSGGDQLGAAFEIGMLLEGTHVFHSGGLLSTRHTDADVENTIAAAEKVFTALKAEGAFG